MATQTAESPEESFFSDSKILGIVYPAWAKLVAIVYMLFIIAMRPTLDWLAGDEGVVHDVGIIAVLAGMALWWGLIWKANFSNKRFYIFTAIVFGGASLLGLLVGLLIR